MLNRSRRHRTRPLPPIVLLIGVIAGFPVYAQDNYLDMLDAYSDDVDPGTASPAAPGADQGSDRGAFESQLRRNFKGSYVLYTKLPESDKEQVFKQYQATGRVTDVRSLIVKLYANR